MLCQEITAAAAHRSPQAGPGAGEAAMDRGGGGGWPFSAPAQIAHLVPEETGTRVAGASALSRAGHTVGIPPTHTPEWSRDPEVPP